ncbi:MAG: PepSY-associated TM helix domain-containing protein, partial [Alphaproteobacteria bacterium]|nr:PepSY-associated TM helix domain-containing protein [Alphaproteobacteria bacterium]
LAGYIRILFLPANLRVEYVVDISRSILDVGTFLAIAVLGTIAAACIVFAVTGFGLTWLHARQRPSTWPLLGLGLLIPAVIALLFIH